MCSSDLGDERVDQHDPVGRLVVEAHGAVDAPAPQAVGDALDLHHSHESICPSEAARAVGGEDWRPLMEPARRAARRLVAAGDLEITQGGRVVDPSTAKGPIRLRLA